MRDAPFGLAPQLLGGREVVRPRIGRVVVLVRVPEIVRPTGGEAARRADGAVRALERVGEDHPRAERSPQALPPGARVGRPPDRDPVPPRTPERPLANGAMPA